VSLRVALPAPLDIGGSLELFRRSGDDLLDRWDGQRLVRCVPQTGRALAFVARRGGTRDAPCFEVTPERDDQAARAAVARAAADTFVPAPPTYAQLLRADPVLGALDARFPGIRQIRQLDLFSALIRCISAQQVNLRWAVTTRRRLAEAFGEQHRVDGETVYSLNPGRIAGLAPEQIRALQFTTSKSVSIVATARALADGDLQLAELEQLEDEEVVARLVRVRGIGRWSAEWVLARTLGRPTVVAGDLGVRKAVGLAYLGGQPAPSEAEVRRATAHWGDTAGAAQALLLHALGEGALTPTRASAAPARRRRSPAASRP
jgi:DNA-3-methyladenine glycosylase II